MSEQSEPLRHVFYRQAQQVNLNFAVLDADETLVKP